MLCTHDMYENPMADWNVDSHCKSHKYNYAASTWSLCVLIVIKLDIILDSFNLTRALLNYE